MRCPQFTNVERGQCQIKSSLLHLIGIFGFYVAGYYFASTTKHLSVIKAFFILILVYFISTILSALLGVYTLAFILGFVSNTGYFILRIILWAHSLKELWFFLQHRTVAEDTYQYEEAPRRQTNSRSDEQKEEKFEKSFSSESHDKPKSDTWKPSNIYKPDDYKKCMEILGLEAPFERKEIKKTYRRMAMKYHPDIQGTGDQEKFVLGTEAYEYLDKYFEKKK